MAESHTKLCLEWCNLNYYVPFTQQSNYNFWQGCQTAKELHLLKDANGHINTGDMVAVLGCSGAGKTTLLAAISQRLRGKVTGDVTMNGVVMGRKDMTRIASLLPQYEINVKTLSAYEHLYFMSHFKMHRKTTDAEKRQRVTDLLYACGLQDASHTRIQSLSGGERKRLSLAEELITDPLFLFCDEPTTGLDSYSAYRVIKTLRNLCRKQSISFSTPLQSSDKSSYQNAVELETLCANDIGPGTTSDEPEQSALNVSSYKNPKKAVICSIHQPSSELFELFTHIILMDGGRIIFQGSTAHAAMFIPSVLVLVQGLGYVLPRNCNPAEFYMKTISDSQTKRQDGAFIKAKYEDEMCGRYSGSWLSPSYYNSSHLKNIQSFQKIHWVQQVYLLLMRLMIEDSRNLKANVIQLIIFMCLPCSMAILYSGLKTLTQTAVQDTDGLLFMLPFQIVFPIAYGVAHVLPAALPIIRREVGEGTYSLSTHYVAFVLYYIPSAVLKAFLSCALIYGTIYYARGFMLFLSITFVLSLTAVAATAYGFFVSTLFESSRTAWECTGIFDLIFRVLGGAYFNVDTIPFAKYISIFFYVNEALFYKFWINVDEIDCPDKVEGYCVRNGVEVLERNSYKTADYTYWLDCLGIVGVAIVFNVIAFSLLRKYVKRSGYY